MFTLRTFLNWTPPKEIGPREILGVEIPAGVGYSAVFFHPSRYSLAELPDDTVELDVGVEVRTVLGRRVMLYTRGISFFVQATVDEDAEADWVKWKGAEELVPLSYDPS